MCVTCCFMLAECLCLPGERWTDGSAVNYHKWAGGQPNRYNNQLNCVSFDMRSDTWSYTNCAVSNSWICKITKGKRTFNKIFSTFRPFLLLIGLRTHQSSYLAN